MFPLKSNPAFTEWLYADLLCSCEKTPINTWWSIQARDKMLRPLHPTLTVRGVLIKIKGVPCHTWRWMKLLLGCRGVMQQQTITSWMWPEWMIDDSFRLPPLTITQMGGRSFTVAPPQRPVTVMPETAARRTWQQIYLVEAFTFCTFTPQSIPLKIRSSLIQKVHWMTL